MSERKSAEIKFRIEPSTKARWQALATEQNVSLSELIVEAVNDGNWPQRHVSLPPDTLGDQELHADDIVFLAANERWPSGLAPRTGEPKSWMFESGG